MIKFFIPDYEPNDVLSYDDIRYILVQLLLYVFFVILLYYYMMVSN